MYESDDDGIFAFLLSPTTQLEKGLPLSKFTLLTPQSAYVCTTFFPPDLRWVGLPFFLQQQIFHFAKQTLRKKMFSHLLKKSLRLWIKHLWQEYNPRFAAVKSRLGLSFSSLTFAFPFFAQRFSATHMYSSHIWRRAQIGSLAQFISGGSSAKLLAPTIRELVSKQESIFYLIGEPVVFPPFREMCIGGNEVHK